MDLYCPVGKANNFAAFFSDGIPTKSFPRSWSPNNLIGSNSLKKRTRSDIPKHLISISNKYVICRYNVFQYHVYYHKIQNPVIQKEVLDLIFNHELWKKSKLQP
jgi:hypothetical protein